jgi:hypothetical protein
VSHRPCQKTAERRRAEKGHRVIAHHAGPFVFWHKRLDDRIADGRPLHQTKADEYHQHHTRQAKENQRASQQKSGGRDSALRFSFC